MAESWPLSEHGEVALNELKTTLATADGRLIRLGRQLPNGKRVNIAVRRGMYDKYEIGETENEDKLVTLPTFLIEVLAQEDLLIEPVGHWDWSLEGDVAIGCLNMHRIGTAPATTFWEQECDNFWQDNFNAFEVRSEYRRLKLGSLLIAASSIVLTEPVRRFTTSAISKDAQAVLKGFGFEGGLSFQAPTSQLANHPRVDQTLQSFL